MRMVSVQINRRGFDLSRPRLKKRPCTSSALYIQTLAMTHTCVRADSENSLAGAVTRPIAKLFKEGGG